MKYTFIFAVSALFFLTSCSTQNVLVVNNTYPHDIKIILDDRGTGDSYTIPEKTEKSLRSTALTTSGPTDELEIRTITIQDPAHKTLQVYRFSSSYLASQNWKVTIPFKIIDTIPPHSLNLRSYYELGRNAALFHLAQEYYNSGEYDKCHYLLNGYGESGSMDLNVYRVVGSNYSSVHGVEREKMIGYCLLQYFALMKSNKPDEAEEFIGIVQKFAPDLVKYIRKNDPEYSSTR